MFLSYFTGMILSYLTGMFFVRSYRDDFVRSYRDDFVRSYRDDFVRSYRNVFVLSYRNVFVISYRNVFVISYRNVFTEYINNNKKATSEATIQEVIVLKIKKDIGFKNEKSRKMTRKNGMPFVRLSTILCVTITMSFAH